MTTLLVGNVDTIPHRIVVVVFGSSRPRIDRFSTSKDIEQNPYAVVSVLEYSMYTEMTQARLCSQFIFS